MYPYGKPRDWHTMSPEAQREWTRREREKDDLEMERDNLERRARTAARTAATTEASLRGTVSELQSDVEDVQDKLDHTRAFIRFKGLWDEFKAWKEPKPEPETVEASDATDNTGEIG